MKKGLFSLVAAAIALVSFSKKDNSTLSFNSNNLKASDRLSKNIHENLIERNTDTTKKGGGRGNETPYRNSGNGGKEGTVGKGGKLTSDPGTGGSGKVGGGRWGDIITNRGNGNEAVLGKGETPKNETGGNGGAGKVGHGGDGKKDVDGNNKKEAVILI